MGDIVTALFVDDDPAVLTGLKRMLRRVRSEIDATFAESGEEALTMLGDQWYDVVVSDMRMPGMNGVELLREVSERHPGVARLILSGHSDHRDTLAATGVAHQYLAKPCDADALRAAILRSVELRSILTDPKLRSLAGRADSLPSVPDLYHRVNAVLASDDPTVGEVASIIAQDPAMTMKILQIVNSSFFGLRREITDITQATNLLGLETVSSLVLAIGVFSIGANGSTTNSLITEVHDRSIRIAEIAKMVAAGADAPRRIVEESYLAGMLQDVGILALSTNWPDRWSLLEDIDDDGTAERQEFGVTHDEFGAYIASLWGLPDTLVQAIRDHRSMPDPEPFTAGTALHIARSIVHNEFDLPAVFEATPYLAGLGLSERLPTWVGAAQGHVAA